MTSSDHHLLQQLLVKLEDGLRAEGFWADNPPTAQALASSQPFCIDTLTLVEWLEFVFLPRIRMLVQEGLPLPTGSQILPVLELYLQQRGRDAPLLRSVVGEIDRYLW